MHNNVVQIKEQHLGQIRVSVQFYYYYFNNKDKDFLYKLPCFYNIHVTCLIVNSSYLDSGESKHDMSGSDQFSHIVQDTTSTMAFKILSCIYSTYTIDIIPVKGLHESITSIEQTYSFTKNHKRFKKAKRK